MGRRTKYYIRDPAFTSFRLKLSDRSPSNTDMNKQISRVWTFSSDSNLSIEYETLQYVDGSTSCACPGWCRRVAADGSRSCKHTRYVDMGTADDHCKATHSYEPKQQQQIHHAKPQIFQIPKLGHRKFAL